MQIDNDSLQWVVGVLLLPITYAGKLLWSNHKSIQQIKEEIAKNYPTFDDIDKRDDEQKEDIKYIRDKLDKVVERLLDK